MPQYLPWLSFMDATAEWIICWTHSERLRVSITTWDKGVWGILLQLTASPVPDVKGVLTLLGRDDYCSVIHIGISELLQTSVPWLSTNHNALWPITTQSNGPDM